MRIEAMDDEGLGSSARFSRGGTTPIRMEAIEDEGADFSARSTGVGTTP